MISVRDHAHRQILDRLEPLSAIFDANGFRSFVSCLGGRHETQLPECGYPALHLGWYARLVRASGCGSGDFHCYGGLLCLHEPGYPLHDQKMKMGATEERSTSFLNAVRARKTRAVFVVNG